MAASRVMGIVISRVPVTCPRSGNGCAEYERCLVAPAAAIGSVRRTFRQQPVAAVLNACHCAANESIFHCTRRVRRAADNAACLSRARSDHQQVAALVAVAVHGAVHLSAGVSETVGHLGQVAAVTRRGPSRQRPSAAAGGRRQDKGRASATRLPHCTTLGRRTVVIVSRQGGRESTLDSRRRGGPLLLTSWCCKWAINLTYDSKRLTRDQES